MDTLNINKISGGLSWNGSEKYYTTKYFSESYDIPDIEHISIELDEAIIWFNCYDITIDNQSFSDSIEIKNYLFNNEIL
jgi:hypothetical protein